MDWAGRQRPSKSSDKLVLLGLGHFAHASTGKSFPSIAALSEWCVLGRQTIIECIARLEASGLIEDTGERVGRTRQVKVWVLRNDR